MRSRIRITRKFICPICRKESNLTYNLSEWVIISNANPECGCGCERQPVTNIRYNQLISYHQKMQLSQPPFRLSNRSECDLSKSITDFHKMFTHSRIKDINLEELVYNALKKEPSYNTVEWVTGSHNSQYDIRINRDSPDLISIKSVTYPSMKKDTIKLMGNRVTKGNGDINEINYILNTYRPTVIYALAHEKKYPTLYYQSYYIDHTVIKYPESADLWEPIHGVRKKVGERVGYKYISPNGVIMEISDCRSAQIDWTIPLSLCRVGNKYNTNINPCCFGQEPPISSRSQIRCNA